MTNYVFTHKIEIPVKICFNHLTIPRDSIDVESVEYKGTQIKCLDSKIINAIETACWQYLKELED